VALLLSEFEKRNVKPIGLSHKGWIKDIEETQHVKLTYPIIADPDRKISDLYGMISPNASDTLAGKLTVRSVFIIDPKETPLNLDLSCLHWS